MGMHNINLGGTNPNSVTVDQKEYSDQDSVRVEHKGSPPESIDVNITNTTGSDGKLLFDTTVPNGCTTNVNLGPNTHVVVNNGWLTSYNGNLNYKLDEGSTLEYTLAPQSRDLSKLSFDLGETGSSTLVFNPGASKVDFTNPPKITGLSAGDQIQIIGATQGAVEGNYLVFRDADGNIVGRFDASGYDLSKVSFNGGTLTYACYLKGTHIATPEGEVKVETLKAGDKVLTASGGVATVKWLGHRTLYKSRIPAKDAVRAFPILFKKDAIAQNVPHRDLTLSPGHHVFFDGTLVPAMMLVNGQTILQQFHTKVFEYFHVELNQFDIILAEGVPAESYVDTGNRSMFQNADEVAMRPDFGPAEGRPQLEGIKVAQQGPVVEAIRKQLLARAEAMTDVSRTNDADLYIEVNGQIIESTPPFAKEGVYRFELPAGVGDVHIRSRSATVRDVTEHARRDIRKIGVGLAGIAIVQAEGRCELDLQDPTIQGMNPSQLVRGTAMRWTDGHAIVPSSMINAKNQSTLELTVLRTYTYWVSRENIVIRKVA